MNAIAKLLVFLAVLAVMVAIPPLGFVLMFLGFTAYFYRKG
jgi:hypothetical protein